MFFLISNIFYSLFMLQNKRKRDYTSQIFLLIRLIIIFLLLFLLSYSNTNTFDKKQNKYKRF